MAKLIKIIVLISLLSALRYPLNATYAAVPHLINYQGRLTDTAGAPLNGSYAITFRIYNAETAGTMLWEETQASVVVQKGIFSVLLGSVTNLALAFDIPYFLEIKVGTEVMTPRQRITSAGYAIRAETSENANNANAVGNVGVNAVPEANKLLPLNSQGKIVPSTISNVLGNWVDKSNNYGVQQAATDGFIIVSPISAELTAFKIYTDSSNPPTTQRTYDSDYAEHSHRINSTMCPVRKGDYWYLWVEYGTLKVYWIPLGN